MPKLYSYIRWSSSKQSDGTSFDRQNASIEEIANQYNLEIADTYTDAAVSSFKGKNHKDGELGNFIDAVEAGVIPSDSWLLVENLDRITREDIISAQELFLKCIRTGLTIVTGMDNRVYSSDVIKSNPSELMISIMLFARAHEESLTKSKRTTGNALALINKFNQGVRSEDGYPIAIKSVGSHVWWIDTSKGDVRPHPERFPAIQKAIELGIKGWGTYKIKDYLDDNFPLPPKRKHNKRKQGYSTESLRKLTKNRALVGERTITIDGTDYKLDNYYPAVCTEEEFALFQLAKERNRATTNSKETEGLITGRRIGMCGNCDFSLSAFKQKNKDLRYICEGGRTKRVDLHSKLTH